MDDNRIPPRTHVIYHGTRAERHGIYIAESCLCGRCWQREHLFGEVRYRLTDPSGASEPINCVRRKSFTPRNRP